MIKVSDYVYKYFESIGVKHAFMLSGGGIMHLVDSIGRSNIEYICCHHEQSASIAAQAYDMVDEQLSVCLVTTGPGGTNALTGVAASFVDSTPVIYMSGQVKRSDFASLRGVRQYGAQENDIISMVKPVTKYATLIMRAEDIAYELEKAVFYATHGRKGPVWIDIPLDVQAEIIDESKIKHFDFERESEIPNDIAIQINPNENDLVEKIKDTVNKLLESKRPLILVGQGTKSSGASELLSRFVNITGVPVVATWRCLDLMGTDDEGFFGSPGLQAPRYSNLITQHCDYILVLGTRLDNMITAFNEEHFAYCSKKTIVDIDINELTKYAMNETSLVNLDIKVFLEALVKKIESDNYTFDYSEWIERCRFVKSKYPLLEEKQEVVDGVDLYKVTFEISKHCNENDTIAISSTSRCNTAGHIAFNHKQGQKTVSSMGMGSMGFALPSAIGAFYASNKNRVVVIEGDGSLQLNLQELETIVSNNINAKIFVFNNTGYAAITTMQDRNFNGFYVGSNEKSGVFMPNMERIAWAYNIGYNRINSENEIEKKVIEAMNSEGPFICDICGSLKFDEIPKCISSVDKSTGKRVSAFLENPYPYLPEDELDEIKKYLVNSRSVKEN